MISSTILPSIPVPPILPPAFLSVERPLRNKVENERIPEKSPGLFPHVVRLASTAMLRRALLKLQRYTAHRAVRAEEYRLARRQWYTFRLKVSFRKIIANVDDEKNIRLKVQRSADRCKSRTKKLCLVGWYNACAPNIEAIKVRESGSPPQKVFLGEE